MAAPPPPTGWLGTGLLGFGKSLTFLTQSAIVIWGFTFLQPLWLFISTRVGVASIFVIGGAFFASGVIQTWVKFFTGIIALIIATYSFLLIRTLFGTTARGAA